MRIPRPIPAPVTRPAALAPIRAGGGPNSHDRYGYTPLYKALSAGSELVRQLLAAGADPNSKNKWGNTLLHSAAGYGWDEVLRDLLAAGADPNCQNNDGDTPLHDAAHRGRVEAVSPLLAAGADLNILNCSPLHPPRRGPTPAGSVGNASRRRR